jgi:hypothetical protein
MMLPNKLMRCQFLSIILINYNTVNKKEYQLRKNCVYYNDYRIKLNLNEMSPMQHRAHYYQI